MPWTRKQVKKLLSSGSPLSGAQKDKMKAELHADPAMGHAKKGSAELKEAARERMNSQMKRYSGKSTTYDHKRPKRQVLTRYARPSA